MAKGLVKNNGRLAGILERKNDGFYFTYDEKYFEDQEAPSISLTLPKTKKEHYNSELFPFFFGILAEGINKNLQCRLLGIDENDHYTRLLKTAHTETIGPITVEEQQ